MRKKKITGYENEERYMRIRKQDDDDETTLVGKYKHTHEREGEREREKIKNITPLPTQAIKTIKRKTKTNKKLKNR